MFCKCCLFYIFALALASFTTAVKVNMHGSLSLGKEVMDTISQYLISESSFSGRRFMNADQDLILKEVESANLCKKLDFCKGKLEIFINEYVTSLAKAIEAVFEGIYKEKTEPNLEATTSVFDKLKGSLHEVRKMLKMTNEKITDETEKYLLVGVIKKISAIFHRKATFDLIERLDADKNLVVIKKRLTQKLVNFIVATEARAERKLCHENHVCLRSLECTKAVNTVLERLINLPDEKIIKFMKGFYEALPETTFYSVLNEVTASEFQVILNDMAYFDSVPTKEILTSIQQVVENRIKAIESDEEVKKGQDVQLVHIILADMDYIYSRQKNDPFHVFLDYFLEWSKSGGRISSQIKNVIKNIEHSLNSMSDDLILKLINEVRVFLEITVDP